MNDEGPTGNGAVAVPPPACESTVASHPLLTMVRSGWSVLPLDGKRPLTLHGVKDATCDERIAAEWARMWPNANVGIALGECVGVVALDIDGEAGRASLVAWESVNGALPATLTNLTARGLHLLFRWPVGRPFPRNAVAWLPGVDVRSSGGYVVAPPSRHPSGAQYTWRDASVPIAEAPERLVAALLAGPASATNGRVIPESLGEGERNAALASLAGSMRRRGAGADAILAALRVENAQRCMPPLDDVEVMRVAASVARYEPAPLPDDIESLLRRERARREVRRRLDAEDALRTWTPPPTTLTVADELALPEEPSEDTIALLARRGHNVLTTAVFKAGKTTLHGNVLRSLVDGEPFLGTFSVRTLSGRVAFWNYELLPEDFRAFLRRLGLARPDRASVLHLRGYRLPLRVEHVEAWTVEWLREREVEVLVLDPWARLMSGNGSENSNDDVTLLTETLDTIKQAAGVTDLFVTAHTPRQEPEEGAERARGAARLDDWADARWLYTRDTDGNRYLRVEGRGVGLDETRLAYDPDTERLTVAGGSRRQERDRVFVNEVIDLVRRQPGITTTDLKDRMTTTTNNSERTRAVQQAHQMGAIRFDAGPRNSKFWYPVIPDWPAGGTE